MIQNKKEYIYYLEQDKITLGINHWTIIRVLIEKLVPHYTWRHQKRLRRLEYFTNCKKGIIFRLYTIYLKRNYRHKGMKMGFSIPENVFGPGLAIVHTGNIVVNPNAKVGKNCRIQTCVNIGASGGKPEAPQIGDNVYIAPGAKIFGDITIASNCAIGANATVGKSFTNPGMLIAGIPAKEIKQIDISAIIPVKKLD